MASLAALHMRQWIHGLPCCPAERSADFMLLALREMAAPVRVTAGDLAAAAASATTTTAAARQEWGELLRLAAGAGGRLDDGGSGGYGGAAMPQREDPLVTAHLAGRLRREGLQAWLTGGAPAFFARLAHVCANALLRACK